MIIKPHTSRSETNPRLAAGIRAERQMAHYLDRHFRDSKRFLVLHDVRIEHEGEVAQMDHLVVHPFGIAIVESKSVSSSVRITKTGEWERRAPRGWTGMPDPLLQAQRQGMVLKRLLVSRTEDLLDKVALGLLQGTFAAMAIDAFAAISDQGTIQRARKDQAPHAMKADAIPPAVERLVGGYRKDTSFFNANLKAQLKAPRDFNEREMLRVAHFLRVRHTPPGSAAKTPVEPAPPDPTGDPMTSPARDRPTTQPQRPRTPPSQAAPPSLTAGYPTTSTLTCSQCGSHDLLPKIGRYGPYGECRACGKNTSAKAKCPTCGAKVYIERAPLGFAGRCEQCGCEVLVQVGSSA